MDAKKIDNYELVFELDEEKLLQKEFEDKKEIYDPPFSWRSTIFKEELIANLRMAFPVLVTNVLQYLLNIETMSFCGRLSLLEMESVGLALSILTALGWCICSGMVTACDTMFAQAFGSNDKKRTGLFLQRGLLILNLIPIFILVFHINIEPILILLGQNEEISKTTGEFIITFAPGLIFMMNYLIFARYMQDQGCLWPPVIAGLCGNIFNILSQFLFVLYFNFGIRAAALCHAFSFGIMLLCELIFIFKTKFYVTTWPGFQIEALYDWNQMFKLSLAGASQITAEVLIWESNVFIGGIIGSTELATQSILLQILNVLFLIYYGPGMSCNIRVGQSLGANKPNRSKAAYRAGLVIICVSIMIIATLILSLRYFIPYIFTDKKEVIDMAIDVFPAVYIVLFVDPFSAICNSTLRGCARQGLGSVMVFCGFYVIGLPCSVVLAFVFKFGIKGLWIGTSIGELVSVSITTLLLECQDWNKQAIMAEKRIKFSQMKSKNVATNEDTEDLLQPLLIDHLKRNNFDKHLRTASNPIFCSTQIVDLPPTRNKVDKSILYKRIFLLSCVLLFLMFGILLHVYLPTEIYRKRSEYFNNSKILSIN